jgi:tRNA threonylcarbamoyladenosine modification (KEOPS) complex Cgi121 subunit/molybdopterin converting factor small subunit
MITIRLLGGARKALGGRASVPFEKPRAKVSEILRFLQENASDANQLNPANLIVAINGVDSGALEGQDSEVSNGDTVTVVTVVHGGSVETHEGVFVAIVATKTPEVKDVGTFLDELRKDHAGVHIQMLNAESVFGLEHISRVISIVMEAKRRGIMIANKPETELLLRLACTRQISEAISRVGVKQGSSSCFVAFSEDDSKLASLLPLINARLHPDESVLRPTATKETLLVKRIGINPKTIGNELLDHLVEKAAILVR